MVGLEGMKHMRKLTPQDSQKNSQNNSQPSFSSTAAVAAVSSLKPSKDSYNYDNNGNNNSNNNNNNKPFLPSITRDLDGGVVLHENIEKILQKKINDSEKNLIPFQQSTQQSTQTPQTSEYSISPTPSQRKNPNKGYQRINSNDLEKKSIGAKK